MLQLRNVDIDNKDEQFRVIEMKWDAYGGSWTSRHVKGCIKNTDIRANLDITEWTQWKKIQARYFGHAVRADKHRLPNVALYGSVEGNSARDDL